MRRSLGTAVFSGMLGVTVFGIFFTPVFYSVIERFRSRNDRMSARPLSKTVNTDFPATLEAELHAVVGHLAANRWPFRLHAKYDESISPLPRRLRGGQPRYPIRRAALVFDHAETVSPRNLERIKALAGGSAPGAPRSQRPAPRHFPPGHLIWSGRWGRSGGLSLSSTILAARTSPSPDSFGFEGSLRGAFRHQVAMCGFQAADTLEHPHFLGIVYTRLIQKSSARRVVLSRLLNRR